MVASFPALCASCTFSHAWYQLYVFSRLASDVYFPGPSTGCMFSRVWYRLYVLPGLVLVEYFPALGIGCMFVLRIGLVIVIITLMTVVR